MCTSVGIGDEPGATTSMEPSAKRPAAKAHAEGAPAAHVMKTAPGNAYELARALNLMNQRYLLETVARDPAFDRQLALDTLMAVWRPVSSHT